MILKNLFQVEDHLNSAILPQELNISDASGSEKSQRAVNPDLEPDKGIKVREF